MQKTLYKIDSKDKVRQWTILTEHEYFYTISGLMDGEKVETKKTHCKGKNIGKSNETTPEQQAVAEAQSKIDKQKDKGYTESVDEARNKKKNDFKPMLAERYDKFEDRVTFPALISPKLDGMRCIATRDGLFSRNMKPILSCPHIEEALADFFRDNPDAIVDGELYNHDLKNNFEELISICRKTKPTEEDIKKSREIAEFHVFNVKDGDLPFQERFNKFTSYYDAVKNDCIVRVIHWNIPGHEEIELYTKAFLEQGYEGAMVYYDYERPYEMKRTRRLLKVKNMMEDEFEIIRILEGIGNRSGMAGKIECVDSRGEEFEAGIAGGYELYRKMWQNPEDYIGKMATVQYQNLTSDRKVPRFGVMKTVRDYE